MSKNENIGAYYNKRNSLLDKRSSKNYERNRCNSTNTEKEWENLQNNFSEQKAKNLKSRE